MVAQSSIFPIFLRAEYRNDGQGFARFQSDAQRAAAAAKREFQGVQAALDQALSRNRNSSGSLDLGVDELRQAAAAQQQVAVAAREVAEATRRAATANGQFDASMSRATRAAFELAKAQEEQLATLRAQLPLLERVQAELDQGTTAVRARLKAEQDLANFRKTANINEGALRLAAGQASVDRAALSGATLQSVLGRTRASNPAVDQQRAQQAAQEAAATRATAAAQEELARAAARLTAQIDPLTAAQQRYDATLAEARRLLQEGAISTQQFANAQAFASAELKRVQNDVNGVTEAQARLRAAEQATAAALRERSAAVAALKAQINPAAAAQEQFNQKVAFAKAALDRGELSQQEYAQAVRLASAALREAGQAEVRAAAARNGFTEATKAGTTARSNVINSVRAERTAFIQLGQQLQDVAVQAQLGTNAFIIFGQQVPQAAFALSGLADSTNKTKAAVGRVAQFLSGPWGAAIFIAVAALGPFVQKLFESEEAADASGRAQRSLTEVLTDVTSSYEEVSKALDEYNRAQERSREVTISALGAQAQAIAGNLREAISIREKTKARIAELQAADANLRRTGDRGAFGFGAAANDLAPLIADQDKQIARLLTGAANVRVQVATEIASINSSAENRIKAGFDVLREEANRTITDVNALAERLTQLNRNESAALEAARRSERAPRRDRSGAAEGRRVAREQEQLAKFGESAAESIRRINERFDEQPRLIDAAAQATRQLDDIIADLSERKPANFEQLIEDAQAAQRTIEDALVRPFEQLRQESENRVAIERALASGREDEAVALQEIFRFQQQNGKLTEQEKQDVEDIVRLERQRIAVLRDQQALFNAQLDVVQTVRRDLTDLLSGRSADFFGNFRQALQDLQGQRLFEDLFGQAFRDIEEQLRGNTPQGRANAAYTANVNETADTTKRLETALDGLTTAVSTTRDRLLSDFDAEFARAANDNSEFQGQITVERNRARGKPEVTIARVSINDLAQRIARGISEPLKESLDDLLGPRFAGILGDIVGGAIAGKVQGGNAGAVLGGAKGLLDSIIGGPDAGFDATFRTGGLSDISDLLGSAGAGAAQGTQIDGLIKALGIKGSRTGAQIGGAAGAATGIPGGAQIGSILGSIIGGLLKGTPRGSATIGGVGGSLGITGTRGNSNSREETASGLAGNVLDAIDDIARQLGASVDAARGSVSIGVRNDNLRVDTTGRGITKTDNGAIDFGDDTEAAIAFAVRDLINDGVITGLRQAEQNLIRAGKDIEQSLRDVLTFRSVFDRLQEIKDPLGFAIGQLNREFEGLIDLFERAGASTEEFASLEELYNLERARAIEDATDRVAGSLKQLLADLTIGDSGLSLRDRRANALGQFNSLAGRVAAGDSSAFDDFAEVSQQLLDIERQLFGSTQSYFDRLAEITRLTEAAIADQTNVVSIGSSAPSPFGDPIRVDRSIDIMNGNLGDKLDTLNSNVVTLSEALLRSPGFSGGGGGFSEFSLFPASRANF